MLKSDDIFAESIARYGKDLPLDIAVEECSELIKAISKLKRYHFADAGLEQDVIEEIADVQFTIDHLKILFECEYEVEKKYTARLGRLYNKLKRGTE